MPEPSLTGPAPALWAGFAAFVVVFVVVLMLIIRGRVIRPAARKAAAPADFFEPAGDAADIAFDDPAPPEPAAAEPAAPAGSEAGADKTDMEKADAEKAGTGERRSAFAGLFARKPKPRPQETEASGAPEALETQGDAYDLLAGDAEDETFAEPDPARPVPNPAEGFRPAREGEAPETARPAAAASVPAQLKTMDDDVEARRREAEARELRRLEAREEAAEQARRRESAAAAALAAFPRTQQRPAPGPQTPRQPAPQPDPKQFEAMQRALETAFAERFDALARDIDRRLDALTDRIDKQALAAPAEEKTGFDGVSEAHFAELANLIGEQLETLRDASATSIDALSRRLDKLDDAPEGVAALSKNVARLNRTLGGNAAATTAGRLQLADILANALPPGRYALARKLSSGKTVDALVHMTETAAPVAVDARFPVEAFDEYERSRLERSQSDAAETEFRRLMLRRIVDIAEKQIAPEETADCALMFIPSEHILTTLYAGFSDIVQESYRARIWMVSPASLTASLYTISALTAAPDGSGADSASASAADAADAMNGAHAQTGPAQTPEEAPDPDADTGADADDAPTHGAAHADEPGVFSPAPEQSQETSDADGAPPFPLR